MRYHLIRETDVANGEGIGVALFVQGCHFGCPGCFNSEAWDFNGGKEWTPEVKEKFLELIDKPYIKRVSILGGEPLADENLDGVLDLVSEIHKRYNTPQDIVLNNDNNHNILNENVNQIRLLFPEKTIWLYTGYTVNIGARDYVDAFDGYKIKKLNYLYCKPVGASTKENLYRSGILSLVDVVVDGRYEEDKKDLEKILEE